VSRNREREANSQLPSADRVSRAAGAAAGKARAKDVQV
jgi:hypothetical protein